MSVDEIVVERSAEFSACGTYRWSLRRKFRENGGAIDLAIIGLNPSTADGEKDDQTVRRLCLFAWKWGYPGIILVNLFALRSTNPSRLYEAKDPIGLENNERISDLTNGRDVLCTWGHRGDHLDRGKEVAGMLGMLGRKLLYFGLTDNGQPKHCLYLGADVEPKPWTGLVGPRYPRPVEDA